MKRTHIFSPAVAFLCLFFFGCANTGRLQLDHTNFTGEIATDQNLSFTFTSDLVPDSLLQQWDTTEYISFSPNVKGKFKWNSPRELIFSPSETFAPSIYAENAPSITSPTRGIEYISSRAKISN